MPLRDIIAIGGSAGSLPALHKLIAEFPRDLPAAIFVVIHLRGREKSQLARVLSRSSEIPVVEACDGQRIEVGKVFVAPPDRHMLLAEGHIHLSRGPKEGLHRPSINATFRSAAHSYKSRVIGVLLSGMLDDGASGLWEIAHYQGASIIQDPAEAQFPSMPRSALEDVPINYKLRSDQIGPRLVKLVTLPEDFPMSDEGIVNEVPREVFSGFTCPECRGPLFRHREQPPEFRCRVGHIFPLQTLIEESSSTQERKMYEAIVSLEEGADMATFAASQANDSEREKFLAEANQLRKHAQAIQQLIEDRQSPLFGD
jgi:two-component system, chemotaxis family, protein-glutamate methylesterase/glutaminase